jgi:IS5 family transposase
MKLIEPLTLKFEEALWAVKPEFGTFDAVLERHSEIIRMAQDDVTCGNKGNGFGRGDVPSVEQIVRGAIYKELEELDYRGLEMAQFDSRLCEKFVKINPMDPYSFQMWQKYISRIRAETLEKIIIAINKIAIEEGIEDLQDFRQDSTVIESNIHYPTNSSLVWDCIRKSQDLLEQLQEEVKSLELKDYRKAAKHDYFWLNVTKKAEKREKMFINQLKRLILAIEQTTTVVKKKSEIGVTAKSLGLLIELEALIPVMEKVYRMAMIKEILGVSVPVEYKIFSIFEQHTDLIVKGQREAEFGHKVNLGTGKSNMILTCAIPKGNPSDQTLYQPTLEKVIDDYGITPSSSVTDGGFASKANLEWAKEKGITNIVFNKLVGSLKSVATSVSLEKKLKRWRSGIEAVISNLKRGFNIRRCAWKGWEHFKQKVLWSIMAYNIRVMTGAILLKKMTL